MTSRRVVHASQDLRAQPQQQLHHRASARKQRGAYTAAFAVMAIVLLGFVGLAMDSGRLFIAKSELQNSADACALAAAADLVATDDPGQIKIAAGSGVVAANANLSGMQSSAPKTVSVSFADAEPAGVATGVPDPDSSSWFTAASIPSPSPQSVYVKCLVEDTSGPSWLVKVWSLFDSSATFATSTVRATAVAQQVAGSSACGMPFALCRKNGVVPSVAQWFAPNTKPGEASTGWFGWLYYPESCKNGSSTCMEHILETDTCPQSVSTTVVEDPGGYGSPTRALINTRFGVLTPSDFNAGGPAKFKPDASGAAYDPSLCMGVNIYNKDCTVTTADTTKTVCTNTKNGSSCNAGDKNCSCTDVVVPGGTTIVQKSLKASRALLQDASTNLKTGVSITDIYASNAQDVKTDREKYRANRRAVLVPEVNCTYDDKTTTWKFDKDATKSGETIIRGWACAAIATPFNRCPAGGSCKYPWNSGNFTEAYLVKLGTSMHSACSNISGPPSPTGTGIAKVPALVR